MIENIIEVQWLQKLADRWDIAFWKKFLIWRHDFFTHEKMRREFRRGEDPFHYKNSAFDVRRYAAMENMIKDLRYEKALEVGCAEGPFTQRLLPYCEEILAVDISVRALDRGKVRVPSPKIEWAWGNIRDFVPPWKFDLILFADVLDYLGPPKKGPVFAKALDAFSKKAASWLNGGGRLLLVGGSGGAEYIGGFEKAGLKVLRHEKIGDAERPCFLDLFERA